VQTAPALRTTNCWRYCRFVEQIHESQATSFGWLLFATKSFHSVFGWCGTPSVSHSQSERLTNSQTVLPLDPKTEWDSSVILMVPVLFDITMVRGKVGWYGFSSQRYKRPKFKGKNDRQIKILGHCHPH
jgi:hypothetical protein